MNYYHEMFRNLHEPLEFLNENEYPDKYIEISVKTTEKMTIVFDDFTFVSIMAILQTSYKEMMNLYKKENLFTEPQLIIKSLENIICVKVGYKQKMKEFI